MQVKRFPVFFWCNTKKYLSIFLVILIFFITMSPAKTLAGGDEGLSISVKSGGQSSVVARFTLSELQAMKQTKQSFSSVDPMPAPSITLAKGVLLDELLRQANIDVSQVVSIKLTSDDGWVKTFTREAVLDSPRYFFPDIVTAWESASPNPPEFAPNAEQNKKVVQPMLALSYFQERFNANPDWSKLNSNEGIKFCYGQQNIEDQVMLTYGKYISGIEVTLKENSTFITLDPSVNGKSFKPGTTVDLHGKAQGFNEILISVKDSQGKAFLTDKRVAVSQGAYSLNLDLKEDMPDGKYEILISSADKSYKAHFNLNISEKDQYPRKGDSSKTSENKKKPKQRAGGSTSGVQGVPADTLTIMVGYYGGPYHTKKVFTLEELGQMPLVKQPYTFIDNMPAVVLDSAIGVKITDILEQSGIDVNSVEAFHFYCTDVAISWYESMPKTFLLDTKRYYYPKLPASWDIDAQSATSGAKDGAQEVEAILALEDNWQRFGQKPDFSDMDTSTRFRLVFGQTDTSTRTACRSAKWIHAIEVMLGGTPPTGITLDKSTLDLEVGSVFQLNANIGIVDRTTDKRVEWKSSDPSIVKVDSRGRVKVLGEGTATITATTVVGGLSASCVINGPLQEDLKVDDVQPISREDEKLEEEDNKTKEQSRENVKSGELGDDKSKEVKNEEKNKETRKQYFEEVKEGKTKEDLKKTQEDTESGVQPWRVYEMSSTAVALPDIKEANTLNPYAGSGAIAFFCLGAIVRFKKYRNEV